MRCGKVKNFYAALFFELPAVRRCFGEGGCGEGGDGLFAEAAFLVFFAAAAGAGVVAAEFGAGADDGLGFAGGLLEVGVSEGAGEGGEQFAAAEAAFLFEV